MDDYKDIINVNWSDISFKHPRMTIYNRSGIFAPFSALSGYKEEIGETERVTDTGNKLLVVVRREGTRGSGKTGKGY